MTLPRADLSKMHGSALAVATWLDWRGLFSRLRVDPFTPLELERDTGLCTITRRQALASLRDSLNVHTQMLYGGRAIVATWEPPEYTGDTSIIAFWLGGKNAGEKARALVRGMSGAEIAERLAAFHSRMSSQDKGIILNPAAYLTVCFRRSTPRPAYTTEQAPTVEKTTEALTQQLNEIKSEYLSIPLTNRKSSKAVLLRIRLHHLLDELKFPPNKIEEYITSIGNN